MTDSSDLPAALLGAMRGQVEPLDRWVRVRHGDVTVAETYAPLLLIQYGRAVLPTYFFRTDEVDMDRLHTPVEHNGRRSWTVALDGQQIAGAAWTYGEPAAHLSALGDRLTFRWDTQLQWYEEEEPVFVHAKDPYKRVDVYASSRHVQVVFAGQVIADTHSPHLLFETHLPTRFYIPPTDVQMEFLRETSHTSQCPYKGTARYWSIVVGDQVLENGAWSYPDPIRENPKIKDLICFYNERTDIYVNGKRLPRPRTPWS